MGHPASPARLPNRRGTFLFGALRPRIILPAAVARVGSDRLRAILAHELEHLERQHDLALGAEALVRTMFFFHPLVWIAVRQTRLARELLCDARAAELFGGSRTTYAEALLSLAGLQPKPAAANLMSPQGRNLEMRLRSVLRPTSGPRGWLAAAVCLVAAPLLSVGLPIPSAAPTTASPVGPSETRESLPPGSSWQSPLPAGRVSSSFGPQRHPIHGTPRHHDGIDLVARRGTAVVAPLAGVVRYARIEDPDQRAAGTVVLLDHDDGLSTYYAHLDSIAVTAGERVDPGTTIGTVGNTGESTGSHLHFEVRLRDEPLDPAGIFPAWTPSPK